MRIAGIIAEYNPFHNGHAYLIEQTRAEHGGNATHIVAVMSGNFTQRGEPALLDQYTRAKMALQNGVDLVLSLPLPWALSSAETFAEGGVWLLNALGCVDMLSFGSECGDAAALQTASDMLEEARTVQRMRGLMDTGLSYADAQRKALAEVGGERRAALLDSPNNTLAIAYLKALRRLNGPITPFTVARMGAEHDSLIPIGGIASASYLRELIRAGRVTGAAPYVPHSVCKVLIEAAEDGTCPSREALAERAVLAVLRLRKKEQLQTLPALSEGLENRLYNAICEADSLESLITKTKTKRYPRTRIQRLVYSAFLGVRGDMTAEPPPYLRVLGATAAGMEILRAAKERGVPVPILTRASQTSLLNERGQQIFALESRATDLFALTVPKPFPCATELTNGIIKV